MTANGAGPQLSGIPASTGMLRAGGRPGVDRQGPRDYFQAIHPGDLSLFELECRRAAWSSETTSQKPLSMAARDRLLRASIPTPRRVESNNWR